MFILPERVLASTFVQSAIAAGRGLMDVLVVGLQAKDAFHGVRGFVGVVSGTRPPPGSLLHGPPLTRYPKQILPSHQSLKRVWTQLEHERLSEQLGCPSM